MTKVVISKVGNMFFLDFFNSKEVYNVKGFDTLKKAKNYANKWNYQIFETLPEGVKGYENDN